MWPGPFSLKVYVTRQGRVPFREWLDGLKDIDVRAKVLARQERIRQGNLGKTRFVGEGVFELKIDYGPGYRVYFAREGRAVFLLLCGGDKRTQNADIRTAQQYWRDYQERGRNHG